VSRSRVFAWSRPRATGQRWPCFSPATKALPESEIAEYEQNDNHRSYKPDDVVHDTLPKFDTASSAARRVGRDQMAKSLAASDVLSLEGRAMLRRSPTVANACRARTARKSLVRTVGSSTFSPLTGYVCTVAVNDFDPKRQIAVTGYLVSRTRLTIDIQSRRECPVGSPPDEVRVPNTDWWRRLTSFTCSASPDPSRRMEDDCTSSFEQFSPDVVLLDIEPARDGRLRGRSPHTFDA
jgi:hypothetical protein